MMNSDGWQVFQEWCSAAHKEGVLSPLLQLLLTQEEKDSITSRCLIVKELLKQEKTQRDMAADLNVSIAKITRGSNELKRTPSELISFLKKNIS